MKMPKSGKVEIVERAILFGKVLSNRKWLTTAQVNEALAKLGDVHHLRTTQRDLHTLSDILGIECRDAAKGHVLEWRRTKTLVI